MFGNHNGNLKYAIAFYLLDFDVMIYFNKTFSDIWIDGRIVEMKFEWIDFYSEFATKLLDFKNDRKTLIAKYTMIVE